MAFRFGSPRRRSAFGGRVGFSKGRLIVAAVIAIFAIISYFMMSDVNEVTGEKQRVALTEAQEVQLGYQSFDQMAQQMGGAASPGDPGQQLVERVGRDLLQDSRLLSVLEEKGSPYKFTFTLLEDDQTVNAFALPGGPVFITRALFEQFENEAQLAGVLGHEIGHVIHRHAAVRMANQQLGQGLVGAVAVGAGGSEGGMSAAQIANFTNGMLQLRYGRKDELESDEYGLAAMVAAGYDPREMVKVMQILKQAGGGGGGGPEFMQTHPLPESRIGDIQAWVENEFPNGVPDHLNRGQALH